MESQVTVSRGLYGWVARDHARGVAGHGLTEDEAMYDLESILSLIDRLNSEWKDRREQTATAGK